MNDVVRLLADMPRRLRAIAETFDERAIRVRGPGETFSLLETACHLRDIEQLGYSTRIRRILAEERPELADVDGARVAEESDYHGTQHLWPAIDRFAWLRAENVAMLSRLTLAEWTREGVLEGVGTVSLAKLAQLMQEHDSGHLAELQALSSRA